MKKNQKTGIVFATVILVALLVAFLGITYLEPLRPAFEPRPTFPPPPGDIQLYYGVTVVLSTVNVALLVFLFSAYLGIYRKVKSDFTLGLMVFSVILLFYALSSNPLLQRVFGFRAFGLGPFAMLPDLFTCVALSVLLYLTFRY
ncbi:MAG: hypothetical protein ABSG57_12235 [Candidatus Bathyarchaeia archaeon]|jgi:hypothetical protein